LYVPPGFTAKYVPAAVSAKHGPGRLVTKLVNFQRQPLFVHQSGRDHPAQAGTSMDLIIVMAAVVSLIVLANVTLKLNQPTLSTIFPFILAAFNVPVLFMGILLMFAGPEVLSAAGIAINIESLDSLGLWFVIMAIWGTLVALPGVRRLVALSSPCSLIIPFTPPPCSSPAILLATPYRP
jgi:hypothetical protein